MYVVFFADKSRHSAWNTVDEAVHQQEVLRKHGYKGVYVDFVGHLSGIENGHYFV